MVQERPRVLVAEDESSLRELLLDVLTALGCRAELVAHGGDALRRLLAGGPYDLVILDEDLPGLNGRAILSAARAAGVNVRAILWSGRLELAEAERLEFGIACFLRKPVSLSELQRAIETVLGRPLPRGL
jgi:CheY-like chemotaxis protein